MTCVVFMDGVTVKEDKQIEKEFHLMLPDYLKTKSLANEDRRWLVDEKARLTIVLDATKFYKELKGKQHELHLSDEVRMALALQLAFDNNKYAVNVFRAEDEHGRRFKVKLEDIEAARRVTGVGKISSPKDYVDSQISFLVNCGELKKESSGEIARIAVETITKYEEAKRGSIRSPIVVSAVAIYHASYKAGSPINAPTLQSVLGVSRKSLFEVGDEVIQIARPDEFSEWKEMKHFSGSHSLLLQKGL